MRLTRAGVSLATAGVGLLGVGMALANLELILVATLPLLLLAVALARRADAEAPTAARVLDGHLTRRGDRVDVELRAHVPRGAGLVQAHAPLPEAFSLEEGSNLVLHSVPGEHVTRIRTRAHARGRHAMGPVEVERVDPHGLVSPDLLVQGREESIDVAPRAPLQGRLRRRAAATSRLRMAELEPSRMGTASTDFRELREYAWGDPPHAINWKATARRMSRHAGRSDQETNPLVNEYEHEGRRSLLVLLDGGDELRVGTSLETGLDHAVEAALALARAHLARGSRVGAATLGARSQGAAAAPDAGSGRWAGLERALSPTHVDAERTPRRVLQEIEPHLSGSRPSVVVLTRLTPRNADGLVELARRIRALYGVRRRALPLTVVDVRALDLLPPDEAGGEAARRIVELEDGEAAQRVKKAGAHVVSWSPVAEPLGTMLVRRGLT